MNYTASLSAQALARVAYVLSGATVFVLLARLLGPSALGQYVFATNLIAVVAALADLGSTGILARDLVASGERRAIYLAEFLVLRVILGAAMAVPAIAIVVVTAPGELLVPLIACCVLLPLMAARFFDPVFQVAGRSWLSLVLSSVYAVAMVAGAAAAALFTARPVFWAVAVYVVCGVAYGIAGLLMSRRLIRADFRLASRQGMRAIVDAAWPFCLGSLFGMLTARFDVFLVEALGTSAMVGQYNAAFRFIDLGLAVVITVLTPLVSVFAGLAAADRRALLRAFDAMMRFVAMWSTAIAVLAPTLTPLVIQILYGPRFAVAVPVLNILAWKFQVAFINLLMFCTLMTVASIRFTWWNSALALAVNIGANLLLIPRFGILGAGIASLASELVQTAIDLAFLLAALGQVFVIGWWTRLAVASLCASAVVYAPIDADRIWLLLPAALVFFGLMRLMRAIPGNPLPVVHAEAAIIQTAQAAPA